MANTEEKVSNLVINILSKDKYDEVQDKSISELYIVKQDENDTDNL